MTKKLPFGMSGALTVALLLAWSTGPAVAQTPLYAGVAVSNTGTSNNIGSSNTSRNVAVDNAGNIYVVFSGTAGIRVAKSSNRGQSYSASVQVSTENSEAEIHVASNGRVYVVWSSNSTVRFSASTDGGASFSAPVSLGNGGPAHISSFGSQVYVLPQAGNVLYRNATNGVGSFSATTIGGSWVFSDVFAHPVTGDVYVVADNPTLFMFKSVNSGANFSSVTLNPASAFVYYSSYALSVGPLGSFIFVGGDSFNNNTGYKMDLANGSASAITLRNNSNSQGRTLVADEFGNFVDGYFDAGSVGFRISYDQGQTYQAPVTVATASSHNLARNSQFQDLVVVYSTSSGVFSTVYENLLPGATATDLVVSSVQDVPAGTYNSVTVTGTGVATLTGLVQVNNSLVVQSGGVLNTNCQPLTGAGSFTLAAGATLGICDASGIAASGGTGAVQLTGSRSFSTDASYVYNGTAAQATGSGLPAQVRNLSTTNANNVTLSQPTSVARTLTVGAAGNLVLNGQVLTLLSSAAGTALAVNSSTGIVSGPTAAVQRYIDPSLNPGLGYRHFSAPVTGSTVADLATTGFAPEVSQASVYNASATPGSTTPFPTVFGYEQSRVTMANAYAPFDRGFVVPATSGTTLATGRGYAVNIGSSALVDFVGQLTNGTQTLFLARNAPGTANESSAGWHLVGNPYPAPLDYSLMAPADRTGLEGAIYVYRSTSQYGGQYRSYVNGVGGNPVLPVGQGFFVRVSAGQTTGMLAFRNSQRLTTPNATSLQRTTASERPLVQLELRGTRGAADVLYAYAENGSSTGFDTQFDAVKRPNSDGLNLASLATDGEALAIDGRPAFSAATVLPLTVGVPAAGTYTLAAASLANLPVGLDALLTDAANGQTVNLRLQPSYTFSISAAEAVAAVAGRFSLHFASRSALANTAAFQAAQVTLHPNPAGSRCTLFVPAVAGAREVEVLMSNALGQLVRHQSAPQTAAGSTLEMEVQDLPAGVYSLRVRAGKETVTKRLVIQ